MASSKSSLKLLTLGTLGVVYGDIGTSVLYTVQLIFGSGLVAFTPDNVYGILSMLFWTLTSIVSIKYVVLVLRADNNGEGGLLAMLALASQSVVDRPRLRNVLLVVGIFGACLFYGDGVITPAVTMLGALDGLKVISPKLGEYVVPLTLAIMLGLFWMQRHGTKRIGKVFGPIMLLWFAVIALLGAIHIASNPVILKALSPYYAIGFIWAHPGKAFILLGTIVLCVTGAEALYADLGHFGKQPIRLAWFGAVMPALTLNYFGQGALLLKSPAAVANPFFMMAPEWALTPLLLLGTAAGVVACQSLISGAFSMTRQVIQLGFLPRLEVLHTSVRDTGQIYLPFVNWALFIAIVLAVVVFRTAENLAAAYGIAVTMNMLITTLLTFFVIRFSWKYPLWLCITATLVFLAVDSAFLTSNLLKFTDGGWFPLAIGAGIFILMSTWSDGRRLLNAKLRKDAIDLGSFLHALLAHPPIRVPGTAAFLTAEPGIVPNAMLHNLKHNKVLHQINLFVTVRNHEVPWVVQDKRVEVKSLGHDCWQVIVNFGFKNDPNLPRALQQLKGQSCELDAMSTSYFLSRDIVIPTIGSGMAQWREKLFAQMHHNASTAAEFLQLPNNAVVELGSKIEI